MSTKSSVYYYLVRKYWFVAVGLFVFAAVIIIHWALPYRQIDFITAIPNKASSNVTYKADVSSLSINPYQIAQFEGVFANQEWVQRYWRNTYRARFVNMGLFHFIALNDRLPVSFLELEESRYFPIRGLDPISGKAFAYSDATNKDRSDYLECELIVGEKRWTLRAPNIMTLPRNLGNSSRS